MANKLEKILTLPWADFLTELMKDSLTEEELGDLLKLESKGANRFAFRMRLYSRRNKLRTQRERKEIAGA